VNGIAVDKKIGSWRYGGPLELVDYNKEAIPMEMAIVRASSGATVNLRQSPGGELMYDSALATASGMATHGAGTLMAGLNAWQDGKNQPVESFGEKEQETWEKVTREESIAQAGLDNEEIIGKGVGAKRANNLLIEDKSTGEEFYLVPGTRLQNKEVFAGMNGKDPLHEGVAEGLADEFGGEIDKWQHIKAIGTIDYYGEERKANVHWFENPTVPGRHKGKVKEWLD